jgi:hypothetical protein
VNVKRQTAGLLIILIAWALSACIPPTLPPAEQELAAVYTDAAKTMAVELTLAAGNTAVARLTEIAVQPAPTLSLPTLLPLPTVTLGPPTATPPPPTPTLQPLPCDAANFVADVTVPANTLFAPGERFVKTWRIENAGSCPWTSAYSLAFAGGDILGGAPLVSMPESVQPGERVDVSIEMTAPPGPGFFQGYWMLRTPSGIVIEITPEPMGALWVQIEVQSSEVQRGEYDFAANYCSAQWVSNIEYLACPGSSDNPSGSMLLLNQPRLESRKENEVAIWLRPGEGRNGWISGEYPAFRVRDGDHFISEVGCLEDNPDCELLFELSYREMDGDVHNLDSWHQTYDEQTQRIELDLSDLEGETVRFILSVTNRGRHTDANGFWLMPHIENFSNEEDLVITWRLDGGVRLLCAEVKVYLTGRRSAEARARSCETNARQSGRRTLTDAEVDQMLDWIDRFASYEFESETPTNTEPLIEQIIFQGEGSREAQINQIIAMQEFMESLYNDIIF